MVDIIRFDAEAVSVLLSGKSWAQRLNSHETEEFHIVLGALRNKGVHENFFARKLDPATVPHLEEALKALNQDRDGPVRSSGVISVIPRSKECNGTLEFAEVLARTFPLNEGGLVMPLYIFLSVLTRGSSAVKEVLGWFGFTTEVVGGHLKNKALEVERTLRDKRVSVG